MGFREVWAKRGGHPGFIDMVGKRAGCVIVVSRAESDGGGTARWNCKCDCGAERVLTGISLRANPPKTCRFCRGKR